MKDKTWLFIMSAPEIKCNNNRECVRVCYFGVKKINDGELVIERDECYGCGLCVDVCPTECIQMVQRNERRVHN